MIERPKHNTNGRVYVEGTVVETADEASSRRRRRHSHRHGAGLLALLPALIIIALALLVARRLGREVEA